MAGSNGITKCVHCKKNKRTRPRGLCFSCHKIPRIRLKYPSKIRWGEAVDRVGKPRRLPKEPTPTHPDSDARLAVYRQRVLQNEYVFHPDDYDPRGSG
jgi:hypothetical protein